MITARNTVFHMLIVYVVLFPGNLTSAETDIIRTEEVKVLFERSMTKAAQEVAVVFPSVKDQIEGTFEMEIEFMPEVVLMKNRYAFRKMTGSDKVVAFAVHRGNIIVLDIAKVYTKPFTLETTLRHELCHLLLHDYIEEDKLPRWLDEGICQWASGGIAELMSENGGIALAAAATSGRLIPMRELERFPKDDDELLLAYEESKSFVEFMIKEYGKDSVLTLLGDLRSGRTIDESTEKRLLITPYQLEEKWHAQLKRKHIWVSYLSNNLYAILFLLAALMTMYGFLRFLKKKREYVDEEGGQNREDGGRQ